MKRKIIVCLLIVMFITTGCNKSVNKKINIDKYKTMIEISIEKKIDFSMVIDKNNNITNIIYLDKYKKIFNDKDAVNKPIDESLKYIMQKLWENNYFDNNTSIKMISYDDMDVCDSFYKELNKNLVILGIDSNIVREISDLKQLGKRINVVYDNKNDFLSKLSDYSNSMKIK